jgi:adenylate cyclase
MLVPLGRQQEAIPIMDRLMVGRECTGIDPSRRFLIEEGQVSRNHFEIRLDPETDRAFVVDLSTNGTRLNGRLMDRAVSVRLQPGDVIEMAQRMFEFRSERFTSDQAVDLNLTVTPIELKPMVLVVGDILNYSTIAEATDPETIARGVQTLWNQLGEVLDEHRGTLNHYAGDAVYAVWDPAELPDASTRAVDFALACLARLDEIGPSLPLRSPDGGLVHMGWSIVRGSAAVTRMTRAATVIGDSTNLAFRLSGLAGREGRGPVMVTAAVREDVADVFEFGPPEEVSVKGRVGQETIYPVLARR